MASLETTRGRQVPAWQQANRYYQQPVDYVNVRQPESTNVSTAPATRRRRTSNGNYTIQKGDTLSAIAKRYGTTVQAIAEANGITDVNKIYVGDSLNIPGNTQARTASTPTQRTNKTSVSSQTKPNTTASKNSSKNVTQQTQSAVYSPVTETGFTEQQMAGINKYVRTLRPNVYTDTDFNTIRKPRIPQSNLSTSTLQDMYRNGLRRNAGRYVEGQLYSAFRSRRYKSSKSKQTKSTFNSRQALSQAYNKAITSRYQW